MSQGRFAKILDRLATVSFRERVVVEDQIRHDLNGTDPSVLTSYLSQLERRVSRMEDRLP